MAYADLQSQASTEDLQQRFNGIFSLTDIHQLNERCLIYTPTMLSPPNTPTKSKWKETTDKHNDPSHDINSLLAGMAARLAYQQNPDPKSKAI